MAVYLNPLLEYLTLTLYSDARAFFDMVKKVIYAATISFLALFTAVYLVVFIRFIRTLKVEIGQTQQIIDIIPSSIIETNQKVREQVWKYKGATF